MRTFFYTIIFFYLLTGGTLALSQSQSVSDLNSNRQKAEDEIKYINTLLDENKNRRQTSVAKLQLVQEKIKARKRLVADIDVQVHSLEKEVEGKKGRIDGMERNLGDLQKSHEQLLYQAFKNRDKRLWVMYILASNDLGLAYRRWQYFKSYSSYINEQALKIKQAKTELQAEVTSLNTSRDQLSKSKTDRQKEVQNMQQEEKESQKIINDLSGQERKLRQQMDEKRKVIDRLNKEIGRIISEETTKAAKERGGGMAELPAADRALSAGFENNRGRLPWPVRKGVVTEKFGDHYHPVFKNIKLPPNNGVNISTEQDSEVLSVFEGVVKRVFPVPGMQNCVMIQHGAYYTLYCKLVSSSVKVGDKVAARGVIGKVFTGEETVVHFEIWKDGAKSNPEKLNPELWLSK